MLAHGRFAKLVLSCVRREFPYQPAHVLKSRTDLRAPRELHPAFYGCYDWHSAVHGHWLLAHLARNFPALPQVATIRKVLHAHLSARNLKVEARYLKSHPGFERPYGWAWALKLAQELAGWDDRLAANLQPLVEVIEDHYLDWLPKQTYPIRSGTHTNTAFGLSFALDYARAANRQGLKKIILQKSKAYYARDRDYPAAWEPGGNDFFSPALVEADLMRRVLGPAEFSKWFRAFLPEIPPALLNPAKVSDRTDGQLAHLDGLSLSRAWGFFNLSSVVPGKKAVLLQAGKKHLRAGLRQVSSGSYAGEHWLASFGAYALSAARASGAADSVRAG
jgi:hypothetical protein